MTIETDFFEGKNQDTQVANPVAYFDTQVQRDDLDLPEREKQERAFYASTFNPQENFKQTYAKTKLDLDTQGYSDFVDDETQFWKEEQKGQNREIMMGILTDTTLSKAQKNTILNTWRMGGYVSGNLRDKYIQKTAAIDNQDSEEDKNMHELLVRGLLKNSQKQKELEVAMHEWESKLDPTATGFAAGAARDFIPGMWNTGNALSAKAAAKYFGYNDRQQFNMAARAFFLGGTYSKEIREAFNNTLDPVQKKDFFFHLMEGAKQLPGFDYNQWSILGPQIDAQPMEWWEEGLLNLASIGDLVGIGSFVRNPIKWFKGLYTYEDSKLAQAIMKRVAPISKTIPQAERVDPIIVKQAVDTQTSKAPNEATGTSNGIVTGTVDPDANFPSMFRSNRDNLHNVIPQIKPTSPIGLASVANPKQARELDKAALMDTDTSSAVGSTKAEIVGSHLLPKLDDDFVKNNPDIAKDIQEMDKRVNELFGETNFDPFLVNVTERSDEKFKLFKAFSETHGAYYQQANSSFRESLGAIEGKARYGRNSDFGFSTLEDAELAKKQIDESFISEGTQSFKTNVIKENDQFYIDMDWKRTYDPFSARMFGAESANSSFAGINTSGISKSAMAKHIFPPTNRLDEWVTKGAFNAAVQGNKVEGEFLKFISNEIHTTKFPVEFTKATEWTQENGKWMNRGELSAMFPNIPAKDLPNLEKAYQSFKRLTDYNYLWADRKHTNDMLADGFNRGIYDKDGIYVGAAKETDQIPDSVKQVWDFDADVPTLRPTKDSGRQIVQLRDPINTQGNRFEYAVVGGNTKLDILPHHTLPKLEGYISRKNIEPWYVIATPKSLKVNGNTVSDANELAKYVRTIGAGKDRPEVEALAKKLEAEFPDHIVDIKKERGDIGDTILTDYKVYKEMTDYGKKRGERLPTLNGFARLEEPLVAQTNSMRSIVRLNAWQNYQEIFQKNFMAAYGKFLPDGKFPNVLTDLKPAPIMTPKDLDDFQIAQRNFEQYANQQYKINYGDEVWKNTLHNIADVTENSPFAGQADNIRKIANKGNLGLKSVKSLANTLFINLNSMAQWIVQPQAILEFMAVEKGFRDNVGLLPGLMLHVLSRASDAKPYANAIQKIAKTGIKDEKEFEAIANAIYKSGLPQSVDMNMMLHGGLDEMARSLNPTMAEQLGRTIAYIPDKINKAGKLVGYTPAQMLADIGGWMFAKSRWERMNPGKNWNTPEHIAQITADGWDIMGSMHTRAGAMPYQDGFISLFFQFQTILHKQFFNTFSSKTLKKAPGELVDPKVKLAAARMAIYGVYGIPGYALVDNLVQEMSSSDTLGDYNRYKGGLLDLVTNTTLDILMFDPNQKMPTDLAMSDRIGPMPETIPYYDIMSELVKFSFGGKSETRLPFINATGSIYEAARDFTNIFRATEVGTVDALQMAMVEAAEMASGYKNWVKAQMIMDMQDKANKFDKKLGLELTTKHAIGQMFGVISHQELNTYKMMENKKEREEFIEQRASQIHQDLIKLKNKIGTPEFSEWVRRAKILNTFTPEAMQEEILLRVLKKDKIDFTTTQESNLMYIRDNAKQENDKHIKEMIGYLKACDSEACKTNLNRLINNNIIKGTE